MKPNLILLIVFILIASLDSVYKYTGFTGLAAYIVICGSLLFAYFEKIYSTLIEKVSLRASVVIAIIATVTLLGLTLYLYPLANSGAIGPGGDGDDALIIAATEMLNGRYPFYPLTYLGNPIAPMPGAAIFAIPFVLLRVYFLQNLFWLIAFFVIVGFSLKSFRAALFLALPVLAVSPTIFQNLAAGSDHISNTVYVLLFFFLIARAALKQNEKWWEIIIPSVLLGVALSSRSNFAFIAPLIFMLVAENAGYKKAMVCMAVIMLACAAVTLPFWLYDPAGFSPLIVQTGKMKQFDNILPYAGIILGICSLILAVGLAFRQNAKEPKTLAQSFAFVQLFILVFTSILFSIWIGQFNLYFGHIGYGLFALFFGVFAQSKMIAPTHTGVD